MPRKLDHIVLCALDLAAMRQEYERLGFTLTPRAVHPFGTHNHLALLRDNFIELLSMNDAAQIAPDEPGRMNLGARTRDYIARRGSGFMMTVLASSDADADLAEFRAKGLQAWERMDFGRDAVLPDGRTVRVGFSLAFVTHPAMPEATFFCCQQRHPPELFWKEEFQQHANEARRLVEVVMVAPDPVAVAAHVAQVLDGPQAAVDGGMAVGTAQDLITVLSPQTLAARYPELAGIDAATPRFVAYRLVLDDAEPARRVLQRNGVAFRSTPGGLVVAPAQTFGVAVELACA